MATHQLDVENLYLRGCESPVWFPALCSFQKQQRDEIIPPSYLTPEILGRTRDGELGNFSLSVAPPSRDDRSRNPHGRNRSRENGRRQNLYLSLLSGKDRRLMSERRSDRTDGLTEGDRESGWMDNSRRQWKIGSGQQTGNWKHQIQGETVNRLCERVATITTSQHITGKLIKSMKRDD